MKINKTRHPVTREPLWYYEDATMDGIFSFFSTYMHPDYDICLFDTITGNTISFDNVTMEKAIPLISRYCTLEDSQVEFIGVNSAVDSYVVGFPFHKQATPFGIYHLTYNAGEIDLKPIISQEYINLMAPEVLLKNGISPAQFSKMNDAQQLVTLLDAISKNEEM